MAKKQAPAPASAAVPVPTPPAVPGAKKTPATRKKATPKRPPRTLSTEGRERISSAQKRRWDRVRAAKKKQSKGK